MHDRSVDAGTPARTATDSDATVVRDTERAPGTDRSAHPAVARLRSELDAARRGIAVLGDLDASRRERVVAELLSAVPDLASRAAHEAGADHVLATIRSVAGAVADRADEVGGATAGLWDRVVRTAVEAAGAVGRPAAATTA